MKKTFAALSAISALVMTLATGSAHADSPLNLTYSVTQEAGGLYDYSFALTLDNHDNTWTAGQGWGWIIFGDTAWPTPSPIADFAMTSANPAPFDSYSYSFGGHNGPSFIFSGGSFAYFTPTAVGDKMTWTGTSATNVAPSDMFFSTLNSIDGGERADRQGANLVSSVPEAGEPAMLAAGLGLLAFAARRQRARAQR